MPTPPIRSIVMSIDTTPVDTTLDAPVDTPVDTPKKPRKQRVTKIERTEENTDKLLRRFCGTSDEWASLWAIFWATVDCPKLAINGSAIAARIDELKTDLM